MAENEQAEGADGAEAAPTKKGKLKLIIAAAGFVVILGAGAGWFFLMRGHHGEEKHAEAPPPKPPSFVEVPDMMVNLVGAPGERVQYLRVKVVLEIKEAKEVEAIKPNLPRVTDLFQTYLRELRPSDINGSAGLFRLKEELTKRVNNAVAPQQVRPWPPRTTPSRSGLSASSWRWRRPSSQPGRTQGIQATRPP